MEIKKCFSCDENDNSKLITHGEELICLECAVKILKSYECGYLYISQKKEIRKINPPNFNSVPKSLKRVKEAARQLSNSFRMFGKLMSSLNIKDWDDELEEGWLKIYNKEEL